MFPYLDNFWPVYLLALAMVVYIIVDKVRRRTNTKRVCRFDFPFKWVKILEQNVPLYPCMPYDLQVHCQDLVMQFIEDKVFEACGGVEAVTDEMMVTIAGNAVIPILGRPTDIYRSVRTILIYPSTFFQKDKPDAGKRLGEAWPSGAVILAWDATKRSARDMRDGKNVAIHEFAHQLDFEDGTGNGAPVLEHGNQYGPWAEVLGKEFERLITDVEKGRKTVIDDYGATNPAEFFAVASETFFEKARTLQRKHPELYEVLRTYYRVDPARWNRPVKVKKKP